jgi:hypothetical protein
MNNDEIKALAEKHMPLMVKLRGPKTARQAWMTGFVYGWRECLREELAQVESTLHDQKEAPRD